MPPSWELREAGSRAGGRTIFSDAASVLRSGVQRLPPRRLWTFLSQSLAPQKQRPGPNAAGTGPESLLLLQEPRWGSWGHQEPLGADSATPTGGAAVLDLNAIFILHDTMTIYFLNYTPRKRNSDYSVGVPLGGQKSSSLTPLPRKQAAGSSSADTGS